MKPKIFSHGAVFNGSNPHKVVACAAVGPEPENIWYTGHLIGLYLV
jgi:threonine/homoserine/homoserine lactone efflux protein